MAPRAPSWTRTAPGISAVTFSAPRTALSFETREACEETHHGEEEASEDHHGDAPGSEQAGLGRARSHGRGDHLARDAGGHGRRAAGWTERGRATGPADGGRVDRG